MFRVSCSRCSSTTLECYLSVIVLKPYEACLAWMQFTSCRSLGMMVTLFTFMATVLVSSNNPTKYLLLASCRAMIAVNCYLRLPSCHLWFLSLISEMRGICIIVQMTSDASVSPLTCLSKASKGVASSYFPSVAMVLHSSLLHCVLLCCWSFLLWYSYSPIWPHLLLSCDLQHLFLAVGFFHHCYHWVCHPS